MVTPSGRGAGRSGWTLDSHPESQETCSPRDSGVHHEAIPNTAPARTEPPPQQPAAEQPSPPAEAKTPSKPTVPERPSHPTIVAKVSEYEGFSEKDIPVLVRMAESDAGAGNYANARREYDIILHLDPNNAAAKQGSRKLSGQDSR